MGWLSSAIAEYKADASARTSHDLFLELFGGKATKSGANVTNLAALEVTAVLACVRAIAEGIAQVPFNVYQSLQNGKRIATEHPLHQLLHRKPNPWMSSFDLRETMGIHAALTGDAIALTPRMPNGRIVQVVPVRPNDVEIIKDTDGGPKYIVTGLNGGRMPMPRSAVWHWRGPSWDGVAGMQVVKMAREAIGLAMVAEESQSALHKNGARPSGLLSMEGNVTLDQFKALRAWIDDNYAGAGKTGNVMPLDRNAKFTPMAMTGVDAQHLETRGFQIQEICRAFRVQPLMAGYSDKAATYASVEQMLIAHVVHTLAPWYERVQQSADCQLLTQREIDAGYYTKLVAAGLLRGDMAARSNFFKSALGSGGSPAWMTPDEVRELEDLNPMGGAAALLPVATNVAPTPPAPTT